METYFKFLSLILPLLFLSTGCEEPEDDRTPPGAVILYAIDYSGSSFLFSWNQNHDPDFKSYRLFESSSPDMTDYELIFESVEQSDTTFTYSDPKKGISTYFQMVVSDEANNSSWSTVRVGYGQKTFYAHFGDTGMELTPSVAETPDSGYAILATVFDGIQYDIMLVKSNVNGEKEWEQFFGSGGWDHGTAILTTDDQGFIMAGHTTSFGAGREDGWLIKTDSDGNETWSRTFGGDNNDRIYDVRKTSDGGFILAGSTQTPENGGLEGWLIKTDPSGAEEWSQTFGDTATELFTSVSESGDGGFVMAGSSTSYGNGKSDIWVVKCDSEGNEQWYRTFGGTKDDDGKSIIALEDGTFIVAGTRESDSGINTNMDAFLGRLGSDGSLEWENRFGSTGWDLAMDVKQTSDGNFIFAGHTSSYGSGKYDVYLVKAGPDGKKIWTRSFGGPENDRGFTVLQTFDGGYVIAGDTESYGHGNMDIWLLKTNPGGYIISSE